MDILICLLMMIILQESLPMMFLKKNQLIKQWQKELNGGLSQEEKELIAKQRGIVFLKDTTSGGEVKTYFAN